jgi:hypothetical protein
VLNDGSAVPPRVLLRAYDLAGAIVSQRLVDPELPRGQSLLPEGCALSPDGSAVVWVNAAEVRRISLATGALSQATLPGRNMDERALAPVALRDGRWLLPVTEAARPHAFRAGYRLSTDGLAWGEFHALRPAGGDGQRVRGASAEADGGVLFVLEDSGLMMAGDGQTTPQLVLQRVATP